MRVKRLEIQGFKSFKDKTVVHFDQRITGIVGPNGCGKSNIVDAFFWVMGEQSYKHMRGSGSEDIIFNGSSKYSPLGLAEATLIMETPSSDFPPFSTKLETGENTSNRLTYLKTKEISVTRRVYRSGEGEYFINGTLARLKDVQELFMDTGVGAKGYSVIEQGQIGKIVNAKPEERRLLIEEAAGIAKYKARKKESLKKMEATQSNLERLSDILKEIEKNLLSLEKQAQKAVHYKKYKETLFEKEMVWGKHKKTIIQTEQEVLEKKKESIEYEILNIRTTLQTIENTAEIEKCVLTDTSKKTEALQSEIQSLCSELSQEKSALELSRSRQTDLASQVEALEKEKSELNEAIQNQTQELKKSSEELEQADYQLKETTSETQIAQASLHQTRQELEKARSYLQLNQQNLVKNMQAISELTAKKATLLGKTEFADHQEKKLAEQSGVEKEKLSFIEEEFKKAKIQFTKCTEQKERHLEQKKEKASQEQKQEEAFQTLQKKKKESLHTLSQLKLKLESLEELDDSHEDMSTGPKATLEWAKHQGHCLNALTDILEISCGYEVVLENWLESKIEYLFTHEKSSIPALPSFFEILKNTNQGRVNIQLLKKEPPLTLQKANKGFPEFSQILTEHGFEVLGELSCFVKSKQDTPAFIFFLNSLIQRVCIVKTAAPLSDFLVGLFEEKTKNEGWSLISLDGVILDANGMLRGGSKKHSGAIQILKRKKIIQDLSAQLPALKQKDAILEVQTQESQEALNKNSTELKQIQIEIQALDIQLAGLNRDVHQTQRALQETLKQLDFIEKEKKRLNNEAIEATQQVKILEDRLKEMLATQTEFKQSIDQSGINLLAGEEELRKKQEKLQTLRIKEGTLSEKTKNLHREKEAAQCLLTDREKRVSELEKIKQRILKENENYCSNESNREESVRNLSLRLAQSQEHLARTKNQTEETNLKLHELLEKSKNLYKSQDERVSCSSQLSIEIEKLSSTLSHITLNLEEKYGPHCLDGTKSETLTQEQELLLSEEIEKYKERIQRLGEVNLMAIEEYDGLKNRYEHLLSEKSDLTLSLENLHKAIKHINETSIERFKKSFEAIANRFETLFPIIFGGGQAKLSLVYPEGSTDLLEAGVDILAQPPGKKITTLTLLSGGEKALTAVSLIFSIFMVKPSPFCVLDEVDAPLDDANIQKFNALLKEMSTKSQFILITHNKKTMEMNDTLYGVTMEEPGVSKMVSIQMH